MTQNGTGKTLRHMDTGVEGTVRADDGFGKLTVQLETGPTVSTEAHEWQYADDED